MKSIKTPFVLTIIAALAISATVVGCNKSDTDKAGDAVSTAADKTKDATADAAAKTADAAKDAAAATKDAVTNTVSK